VFHEIDILNVLGQPIIYKRLYLYFNFRIYRFTSGSITKRTRVNLEMGEKYANLADRFVILRPIRLEVSTC
jgi:hypothetical protein